MIKHKSLYSLWLEAHKKGGLPNEWKQAHVFLVWATANGYRPEYGYEGNFTPESLKAAIPNAKTTQKEPEKAPDGMFDEFEKNTEKESFDVETLMKLNKPSITELAASKDIELKGTETKRQIAELIVAKDGAK